MIDIAALINNPGRMNRDTLYELRQTLALYPYFQTVRLLMLQNLYLLRDPSFDEELRQSAGYITDRRTLFNVVEGGHYQWHREEKTTSSAATSDRTIALIDTFLESIPGEKQETGGEKRRPTPADATVDYVAYLLETEDEGQEASTFGREARGERKMQGQNLIDHFLEKEQGRFELNRLEAGGERQEAGGLGLEAGGERQEAGGLGHEEEFFTETLARIYIKQGRYQKALDIIRRLSVQYPKKNAYFADQIRFLEKLIINSNKTKK